MWEYEKAKGGHEERSLSFFFFLNELIIQQNLQPFRSTIYHVFIAILYTYFLCIILNEMFDRCLK